MILFSPSPSKTSRLASATLLLGDRRAALQQSRSQTQPHAGIELARTIMTGPVTFGLTAPVLQGRGKIGRQAMPGTGRIVRGKSNGRTTAARIDWAVAGRRTARGRWIGWSERARAATRCAGIRAWTEMELTVTDLASPGHRAPADGCTDAAGAVRGQATPRAPADSFVP